MIIRIFNDNIKKNIKAIAFMFFYIFLFIKQWKKHFNNKEIKNECRF